MFTATVVGNLGRDAETKTAGSGTVTEFNVASSTKVKGEDVTTWVRCALWNKRGEALAKYLLKGKTVAVSGSVKLRTFTKKDGSQGTSLEMDVSDVKLCGGKSDGATSTPRASGDEFSDTDYGYAEGAPDPF